jgi:hypothetical protein
MSVTTTDPKVYAVVAAYCGPRRWTSPLFLEDCLHYIKSNVEAIKKHSTFVRFIEVVVNGGSPIDISHLDHDHVIYTGRPNQGFSYGAWNSSLIKYKNEYDYAVLLEDDYKPVYSGYDKELIKYVEADPWVGYVCGLLGPNNHAAVSNGLLNLEAFRKLPESGFRLNTGLSYGEGETNQYNFPLCLEHYGYKIVDHLDKFCTPFNSLHADNTIKYFGNPLNNPLIFPDIY